MADKTNEKGTEKGLLARTATYTSKKARRAQTKLKQRVGKGDETKDEVFDEFVLNFNKQQASATRLHNELKNYVRCITAMQVAHLNFGEAVKEVYEDDWSSRTKLCEIFQENDCNWTTMRKRVTDEVLEPLTSYLKPFLDVKGKISKRARKLVDYDHSRHAVDTLRAKGATKTSETKKLNQAEEEYQKAKDVFIDLTSELYEELPALYDSRIGFYVSCFQSIFTLQEVFHRDAALLNHQLNDLMDQLITDFSAGTYSTRKPFSAGLENSTNSLDKEKDDTKLSSGSLAQFYDVAVPDDDKNPTTTMTDNDNDDDDDDENESQDSVDSPVQSSVSDASTVQSPDRSREEIEEPQQTPATTETAAAAPENTEQPSSDKPVKLPPVPSQPQRPAPQPPARPKQPELFALQDDGSETPPAAAPIPNDSEDNKQPDNAPVNNDAPALTSEANDEVEPPPQESGQAEAAAATTAGAQPGQTSEANNEVEVKTNSDSTLAGNVVAYRNNPTAENPCNLIVPNCIYKVIATHKYIPEDEDELTFEKGEIIHVVPYDDPDEQDDGWLMGVMDSNGYVGVFPENFSKKIT